jgi:hypothetical protein
MSRYVLFFSIVILLGFTSCVKNTATKACFTFSKESPKVNDTLYLLNCSENYQKAIWYNTNGFYPGGAVIDSVQRHQQIVVTAAGLYTVAIRIGKRDFYSNSTSGYTELIKSITVLP